MLRKYFIILLLIFIGFLYSQTSEIDSLHNKLSTSVSNNRFEILYKLSQAYNTISMDLSLEYAKKALAQAQQNKNKKNQAQALMEIGEIYLEVGIYEQALNNCIQSLGFYEQFEDKKNIANILSNIGNIYLRLKQYDSSKLYFLQAKTIYKEIKNLKGELQVQINLASLFTVQGKYDNALLEYQKVLELSKELNNLQYQAVILNNIGIIHKTLDQKKLALEYFNNSLEVKKQIGDEVGIATSLLNLGNYYRNLGLLDKALEIYNRGKEISKKLDLKDHIMRISYGEYKCYKVSNNSKKALSSFLEYSVIKDSLISFETNKKIAEIKIKFESEKKEKQIELLKKSNKIKELSLQRKRMQIIMILVVLFMVIFIFIILNNKYKMEQKLNTLLGGKNNELRQSNISLKNSEISLMKTNSTKDKFFTIIAHDLKDPFYSLMKYCEIFYELFDSLNEKDKKQYIKDIILLTNNILKLLENLLVWTKSQTGNLKFEPDILDLNSAVEVVIQNLETEAKKKEISIKFNKKNGQFIFADTEMIVTVIRNLVYNSIKFTPRTGKIEISFLNEKDKISLIIKDNGIGLSKENQIKVFQIEENFKTEGTEQETGTGLGLLICKEFVKKNNGEISIESSLGKGSIFTLTFNKYNV